MKRFLIMITVLIALVVLPFPVCAVDLKVAGKSAALMEVSTGTVLYESNSHERLAPASVTKVKIKVPDAPSGNGRTERQTRSVKEIQDLLNQGYRPGTKTQLASSEVQRCVSLIQAAYLAKWERPPWTASLKEAQLKVKFLPGGRVASWTLSKSSGDAAADKTVRRAAAMVSEVRGLSDSFIKSNGDGVIVRFKVTP